MHGLSTTQWKILDLTSLLKNLTRWTHVKMYVLFLKGMPGRTENFNTLPIEIRLSLYIIVYQNCSRFLKNLYAKYCLFHTDEDECIIWLILLYISL